MRTLKKGVTGPDVAVVQSLLRSQGFFDQKTSQTYDMALVRAVADFQASHLGRNGLPLMVDGEVGPETWWALNNPSGEAQRSGLKGAVPKKLSGPRKEVIKVALSQHGVKESPDGSNWGPDVSKYLAGVGPAPWCAFFVSWCVREATGSYPMGKRHGHCLTFWREAKAAGKTHKNVPSPGDIFIMLYRSGGKLTGSGHTGFVLGSDGETINTIEGNAGNRVKVGSRSLRSIEGFIALWPAEEYEHGLLAGTKIETLDALATR